MSVNLKKSSNGAHINLKKEEPHKTISLTKDSAPSGAAPGTATGTTATGGTGRSAEKKGGSRKWIGIVAAAVLLIGAAAVGLQSNRNSAVVDTPPAGTDPGGNTSSSVSTDPAGASGDESSDANDSEGAAGILTDEDPAAEDATAAEDDTSASGDSESMDSDTADDAAAGAAGVEAEVIWSKRVGNYEIIVSNDSWNVAFNDCLRRGGKLCTIDSVEENAAVISALKQAGFYGTVYLGGMRNAGAEDYHWIDGDKQMLEGAINQGEYKNFWYKGEPSYTDGSGREERYMTILYNKKSGWVWNDVAEDVVSLSPDVYSGKVAYICEYN